MATTAATAAEAASSDEEEKNEMEVDDTVIPGKYLLLQFSITSILSNTLTFLVYYFS